MPSFFSELKRRNVLRAAALYIGAAWALSQGLAQLLPVFDIPNWVTRWLVIAAVIGFPFLLAFAWFYEFTPEGLKRDSQINPADSITHHTGKKVDRWIIAALVLSVVLLITDRLAQHRDASAIPNQSIAVLPLTNESGNEDEQYFSDGLSENLIIALSQFANLKVIGRSSTFQFRGTKDDSRTIGAKLGVAHLLEGTVRRAGDIVRISAELINASDGSTLWSARYDRPYKDLFAVQDDITAAIAHALQAKLLTPDQTATQGDRPLSGNLDAYTAFLQGKFYFARSTESDDEKAIMLFTTATRLDSRYALAWAELSRAWSGHASQYLDGAPAQHAYTQARASAQTALTLEPTLAAAHSARGWLLLAADFNWTDAEAEYRRALQLEPNNGRAKFELGRLSATLGRAAEAVDLTRQALDTDPLNARWYNWLTIYLTSLDRTDEADRAIRKAIELQPGAAGYREQLTILAVLRGDAKGALAAAQQESAGIYQDIALAFALQIGTDKAAADAALKNLVDQRADLASYQITEVFALRNDADKTFEWLDRAWANRDPGVQKLLYDRLILRYKADPRFAAFCKKVGLPVQVSTRQSPS
jgi:TolB-like protein/Flp pilus assembly protein TadD